MIKSTILTQTLLFLGGMSAMAALYFNRAIILSVLVDELKFFFLEQSKVQYFLFFGMIILITVNYISNLVFN